MTRRCGAYPQVRKGHPCGHCPLRFIVSTVSGRRRPGPGERARHLPGTLHDPVLRAEILIPVALAILLSILLAPLVNGLQRLRLPKVLAVIMTVLLVD